MDEEEFQRLVEPLRLRRAKFIEEAHAAGKSRAREVCIHLAHEASNAIDKLERQYEYDKTEAAIERRLSSAPLTTSSSDDLISEGAVEIAPLSLIEYHDQLVKEWLDGEKALIADLYPETPEQAKARHLKEQEPTAVRRAALGGVATTAAMFGSVFHIVPAWTIFAAMLIMVLLMRPYIK